MSWIVPDTALVSPLAYILLTHGIAYLIFRKLDILE